MRKKRIERAELHNMLQEQRQCKHWIISRRNVRFQCCDVLRSCECKNSLQLECVTPSRALKDCALLVELSLGGARSNL